MKKTKKERNGTRGLHSKLEAHKRQGKKLIAPLMQIKNTKTLSWLNDRMPEMIWAALILEAVGRKKGLEVLRRFCILNRAYLQVADGSKLDWDSTLTALADLPDGVTNNVTAALDAACVSRELLSPLLLFKGLPAIERWRALIPPIPTDKLNNAWQALAVAAAAVLDHQSQTSTDIRWMNVMFKIILVKIIFREGVDDDFVESLRLYPDHGEMRSVRPSIRAMELAFRSGPDGDKIISTDWCLHFWSECLERTECIPLPPSEPKDKNFDREAMAHSITCARRALLDHWAGTITTSGLDPRHDTNFSLGFYALACLSEICMGLNSRIISGRLLVRTITEVRINLAYLAHKDDKDMWARFRSYGSGQAKLALLKYEEIKSDQPSLVCIETLKALANEDFFQEFVNIDLGSWSGSDLRKMAEECGAKGDYDRFYGWTSAFVHGQWAAARDAVFCTCLNPLHRAHREPMPYQRPMESCTADAVFLINSIFSTIDECYPGLAFRLSSN